MINVPEDVKHLSVQTVFEGRGKRWNTYMQDCHLEGATFMGESAILSPERLCKRVVLEVFEKVLLIERDKLESVLGDCLFLRRLRMGLLRHS
jgi:hypothetical protein